jgi:pyruvate kinase
MSMLAEAAEESPDIHGRARSAPEDTAPAAVMHAAVELADDVDAVALIVPTTLGGSPRACAKYRSRLPIIALPHEQAIADQLTLEWGVYPRIMPVGATVDELVESALISAKEFAGLPTGARVVITAGRQTGTTGGTSLIMVREIP